MSDQDTSIFGNKANTEETPPQNLSGNSNTQNAQNNDPFADLLGSIRNERGEPKYKSTEDALNGLKHAQEYIPTIKQELSQKDSELNSLRAEVQRLKAVEEVVERLTAGQREQQGTTSQPVLDEQKIAELINRTLTSKEQESLQRNNLNEVVSTLQSSFGTEAEKIFYSKAAELGMSQEQINAMAASSPKAVMALFGVSKQAVKASGAPSAGSVNTAGYQPTPSSFVGRNAKEVLIGATTSDLMEERSNANKMVDELHEQGLSVHDLTDPKKFFKFFK